MELVLSGRTDIEDLFRLSGLREYKVLNHTPFLAFKVQGDKLTVDIVRSMPALLAYPDETKVMVQWTGKWRSDFFHFSVGDLRAYNAREVKQSEGGKDDLPKG